MKEDISILYSQKITEAKQLDHPRVLVNICSHGNETVGLKVEELCRGLIIKDGSCTFNIGNPLATKTRVRFIESDLNRSFPGNTKGTYEECVAHYMMEYIKLFDYVIDIHSTVSGMENCLIVEDDSAKIQQMISACIHCKTVLHMNATKGSSIFTACRTDESVIPGIAFEYGDNSQETAERTYEDLIRILEVLGIINIQSKHISGIAQPDQFDCYATLPKSVDDITNPDIINYELVKTGDIIGYTKDGEPICAETTFYPVLFGETNYKTIFGFMARRL